MSDAPALRVAVVGGSSGLGRCIGIGLAEKGAQVAFVARRQDRLENAAKEAGNDAGRRRLRRDGRGVLPTGGV